MSPYRGYRDPADSNRRGRSGRTRFLGAGAFTLLLASTALVPAQQDPDYVYTLSGGAYAVDATVTIATSLDSTSGEQIGGWAYGVCHDATDLELLAVEPSPYISTFVWGGLPQFWQLTIEEDGYSLAAVIFAAGAVHLLPGDYVITTATYTNLMPDGGTTMVEICPTLTTPSIPAQVVPNGTTILPVTVDAEITSHADVPFIRGDANDDGLVNIADVIALLHGLFLGGEFADCFGADDANADGALDIADPIKVWGALFGGGTPPPPPFPDCSASPTGDPCHSRHHCP